MNSNELHDKILIVEDDAGISRFLRSTLSQNSYQPLIAETGAAALKMASSHCPDCILLDLGLPDLDGGEIIRELRKWNSVPIIVISARTAETDKAEALDLGADDYLTKPFGTIELLARIRTALRHRRSMQVSPDLAQNGVYKVGELKIDYFKHRVYMGERDTGLTPQEFKILSLLGKNAGKILTYRTIMLELWGPYASRDNKILRVHMASIRRKVEPNPDEPKYIFTEIGVGYRLADENDFPEAPDA